MFAVSGQSSLDIYRDFGATENRRRKVLHAYTPKGWYKLVQTASKNTVFIDIRMTGKEFVSVMKVQQKLVS
jgi:hypothetical protein